MLREGYFIQHMSGGRLLYSYKSFKIKNKYTHSRATVCVEILRPSQPNGVMSSAKRLTSIMHILLPETDNCHSWISGRERMTVENISWSVSTKECCRPWRGLNPRPPCLQSDGASNWATEADSRAIVWKVLYYVLILYRSPLKHIKKHAVFVWKITNLAPSSNPETARTAVKHCS